MRRRKGQSILEYTLLITAVVLAVVWGANSIIGAKAKAHLTTAGDMLDTANTKLSATVGP